MLPSITRSNTSRLATLLLPIPPTNLLLSSSTESFKLINLQKSVPLLSQRILDPLHDSKHLLLLKTAPDDLYTNRESVHLVRIIKVVSPLSNAVEISDVEIGWQRILLLVYMGNGEDTSCVIQLCVRIKSAHVSSRCGNAQGGIYQVK